VPAATGGLRCERPRAVSAPPLSPPAVLAEHLMFARRAGHSFAEGWQVALEQALAVPSSRHERREWLEVLGPMRGTWQDCWERKPAPLHERMAGALR